MKICLALINKELKFSHKRPALLFALSFLIGLSNAHLFIFPFLLIWCIYLTFSKRFSLVIFVAVGAIYGSITLPNLTDCSRGYFSIDSLSTHHSPFKKNLLYKGTLYADGKRSFCRIYHPFSKKRPKANRDYIVEGIFKPNAVHLFKAKKWHPIPHTFSLAEMRFQMKARFKKFLNKQFQDRRTASFLNSLLTGDVKERQLRFDFTRVGLQHLLAISGFHFAILLLFFSFTLDFFFKKRDLKLICLLLLMSLYFLFIGSMPAVQRSWLCASLYLIAKWANRFSDPLNILGSAMLIEMILNPLIITSIGFQLSFTSCFGILFFYPLLKKELTKRFPPTKNLNLIKEIVRLLSLFFQKGIALTFAVNLAIFPLLLYHFHTFPLLSFIYNLFAPILVSLILFSLLLGILTYFLFPPFTSLLFKITNFLARELLDLVSYPPNALDYSFYVGEFSPFVVICYLFFAFCFAVHFSEKQSSSMLI